jgi:hypothetical protein
LAVDYLDGGTRAGKRRRRSSLGNLEKRLRELDRAATEYVYGLIDLAIDAAIKHRE